MRLRHRLFRLWVPVLALALVVAACGSTTEPASDAESALPGESTPAAAPEEFAYDEVRAAGEHMEVWALALTAAIDEAEGLPGDPHTKAAETLAAFDFLFREHSVLVAYATDVNIDAGQDVPAFIAAAEEVEGNSEALRGKFLRAYDAETADEFHDLWGTQVEQFYRYAEGVRLGDQHAKRTAQEELDTFVEEYATFVEDATVRGVEAAEVEEVMGTHVDAVTETIEAQKEEGTNWFERLKRAVDESKILAETIAGPIADQLRLEGDTHSEAAKIRAELSARMAETAWYVGYVTRGVLDGEQSGFEQAQALLDANTSELGDVLGGHLPDDAVRRVEELWGEHNDLFVDYARALAGDGEADTQEIVDELATWGSELADALAEATSEAITADAVEHEAAAHVETVRAVIDAQAAAAPGG